HPRNTRRENLSISAVPHFLALAQSSISLCNATERLLRQGAAAWSEERRPPLTRSRRSVARISTWTIATTPRRRRSRNRRARLATGLDVEWLGGDLIVVACS